SNTHRPTRRHWDGLPVTTESPHLRIATGLDTRSVSLVTTALAADCTCCRLRPGGREADLCAGAPNPHICLPPGMVSFFGLRLGGDKKKSQKPQGKQPQKWDRIDQNTLGEGQFFGQQNFSRPQFPNASSSSSRPGTAGSSTAARRPPNWRAVFGNPGMASSMTDLAPPSLAGSGGLRHHASEANLRTNCAGGSTTSLALPAALGGAGARPGTPSRPATSKTEWVNPLDVHFCKDTSGSRPGTPLGPAANAAAKSPLGQFEFGVEARTEAEAETEMSVAAAATDEPKPEEPDGATGYPSPPQSDKDSERAFSPVNTALSPVAAPSTSASKDTRRNAAPSALRN
ncbi:Uncharacterized protein TPAR_04045, partial [Tolypocladium paradoxum]